MGRNLAPQMSALNHITKNIYDDYNLTPVLVLDEF